MRLAWFASVCAACVLLAGCAHGSLASTSTSLRTDWGHRHLIFLGGVCPSTSSRFRRNQVRQIWPAWCKLHAGGIDPTTRDPVAFGNLINRLQVDRAMGHLSVSPLYFSYADSRTYLAIDTHEWIAGTARRLDYSIRHVIAIDPSATFDLIGQDIGGVIAAYWVVRFASTDLQGRVHALITLDSPLRGWSMPESSRLMRTVGSGEIWSDLLVKPGHVSPVVAAINAKSYGLAARLPSRVYTVSNCRDQVVPCSQSLLAGATDNKNIQRCNPRQPNRFVDFGCHGDVLASPQAVQWMESWIEHKGRNAASAPRAMRATPGGQWLGPANFSVFHGKMTFTARAYTTSVGSPAIVRVAFMVAHPVSATRATAWATACVASPPVHGDRFRCVANIQNIGSPLGDLDARFDVFDDAGNMHRSAAGDRHLFVLGAPCGHIAGQHCVAVWTDRIDYRPGDPIQLCYSVPAATRISVTDTLPDGSLQDIFSDENPGSGQCKTSVVGTQPGRRNLELQVYSNLTGKRVVAATAIYKVGKV